jgi:HK97 family phage portal protein
MDNTFSIFKNLIRRRETPVPGVPNSTKDQPAETEAGDWQGHVAAVGGRNSLLVSAWYRGVTVIMHTMGQMVVEYQRLNKVGGNFVEDRYGTSRKLNYLLQVRPNDQMSASTMLEQIEFRKIYYGNAYVYIDRDFGGEIQGFYLCQNGSYNPLADTYTVSFYRRGSVVSLTAPAADVLHFRNTILSDDYMTGIPTLLYATQSLRIAATADGQTLEDMAKGGRHKIIVQEKPSQQGAWGLVGGNANKDELKKVTKQLGEDMLSKDVMLTSNVVDTKIISQTAMELRTLENRNFQVADLARFLGVPKIMMMDDSGSSYKSPEAATQEFLLRTISPRVREYEDELNAKLLTADDFGSRRIHVCEQALRRLDPKGQSDLDKVRLETGVMSPNELRAQYDLGTIENGDVHYVSTNLAELGSEKLRAAGGNSQPKPEPAQTEPTKKGEDGEGEEGGEA